MRLSSFDAVLFDLDGTLIDSEYFYFSNWAPILSDSFNITITFDDWIRDYAGHTLVRNVQYLNENYHVDTTEEFMWNATRANYAKADMRTIRLMPYAKEILDYLKSKKIRIALVTSSYRSTVDTVLGHHGLLEYFDFFITRELVNYPKPHAEPYSLALSKLNIDKDRVVAIEDTITGVTSAIRAGVCCVAVSKHETERLRLVNKADYLFHSLNELIEG